MISVKAEEDNEIVEGIIYNNEPKKIDYLDIQNIIF